MKYTLGLDIGYNSIGWAMIEYNDENPVKIINAGVRIFETPYDVVQELKRGNTKNTKRREARLRRRQIYRKTKRLSKLLNFLISKNFFNERKERITDPFERNNFISQIDKNIDNPYFLRRKGLYEKLELEELARVFYHIAQHRGFLSSKREKAKIQENEDKKKESEKVKKEIENLDKRIKESNSKTLGEYFASLVEKGERVRGIHTSRKMYQDEFDKIYQKQKEFYPDILTDDFKKKIENIIFYQKELKSQKDKVGKCTLEPKKKRAPKALLDSQRFRYISKVNNLTLIDKKTGEVRELSKEEKSKIYEKLEVSERLSFNEIKKLLNLNSKEYQFNLEKGGEKNIIGNKTNVKMKKIFDGWDNFDEEKKNSLVDEIRTIVKTDALKRRGLKLGLDEEKAKEFSETILEDGYLNYSKSAIKKLLPLLKEGYKEYDAIQKIYRTDIVINSSKKEYDILPPVKEIFEIRNPLVERTLSQIRILLNHLIKKYGKPEKIKIELARELKLSKKELEKIKEINDDNKKANEEAIEFLKNELKITEPTKDQITKYLLAKECNWTCPYTGKQINIDSLFGAYPLFDIEHIIPFDRSFDNSFLNKTLCYSEENRNRKHNKTPYEAYYNTNEWDDIIKRVENFQDKEKDEKSKEKKENQKLKRFKMNDEDLKKYFDNFVSQNLNDTRYASKNAKKYLGLLYGDLNDNGVDKENKKRIFAVSGKITSVMRDALHLIKSRDDHRHHALDAVAIALTDDKIIKKISQASKNSNDIYHIFKNSPLPWENFNKDVKDILSKILVSIKVNKKVKGQLHDETFYKKPFKENRHFYTHQRIKLEELSEKDVEKIVDERIKKLVKEKLNGSEPSKIFKDPKNHPYIEQKNGKKVQIHKVSLKTTFDTYEQIGKEENKRYVRSADIHHIAYFEDLKTKKWDAEVVSLLEAYKRVKEYNKLPEDERKKIKDPIIKKDYGEGKKFLFSLSKGEIIELDTPDNKRELYVVKIISASNKQIQFKKIYDAKDNSSKVGLTGFPSTLQNKNCKKVVINILGEKHYSND